MIRKLAALSVLLFAFTGTAQAASQIVTFNSDGSDFLKMNNWQTHQIDSSHPDYQYSGLKSMADELNVEWVAINMYHYSDAFFATASTWTWTEYGGEPFDLNDFWLASGYGSQTLRITGYDDKAREIYQTDIEINTTAQQYTFDWKGITVFTINTREFGDFVRDPRVSVDNTLEFWVLGSVNVTAAPEPETYAMLLAGLGVVGVAARRRRTGAAL